MWLAFDSSNNLYFTNSAMSGEEVEVSKATPSGVLSTFVNNGSYANGLAFDSSGNLYISNFDNSGSDDDSVDKVTPAGVVTPFATGFSDPAGLTFDSAGNLYVANSYPTDNTVSEVTPEGVVSTYASGFSEPTGLAFDTAGNLISSANSQCRDGERWSATAWRCAVYARRLGFTAVRHRLQRRHRQPAGHRGRPDLGHDHRHAACRPWCQPDVDDYPGTPPALALGGPSVNTLTIDRAVLDSAVQHRQRDGQRVGRFLQYPGNTYRHSRANRQHLRQRVRSALGTRGRLLR